MIGRLTGTLLEKNPPQIVIDVAGVGYEVDVPMSTFYHLPAVGERLSLHIHHVVREDGQFLFGFAQAEERTAFRQLLKVSGIGARTALAILSGLSVSDLAQAVALQESGRLVKIPGIGKKTAERLLIELRDRIKDLGAAPLAVAGALPAAIVAGDPAAEAVSALVALGYKPAEAARLVQGIDAADKTTEQLIRLALQKAVR